MYHYLVLHFQNVDALIHVVWYVLPAPLIVDLYLIYAQELQGLTSSWLLGNIPFTEPAFQLQTVMNVPIIVMVQSLYALRLWRRKSAQTSPFSDPLNLFVSSQLSPRLDSTLDGMW